jgi:hypothetical protein
MPLVIGVHSNNLHLRLAARWPGAFDGLDATFVTYDEGRDTGRLIAERRIDVGGTGSTPPILDQAQGLDVLYLAASAPRPANGAVLVRAKGGADGVADLAGCRVALLDGSFHTFLLARVLERAGLGLRDVVRVELGPDAARAALADGAVDAWVAAGGRTLPPRNTRSPCLQNLVGQPEFAVLALQGLQPGTFVGRQPGTVARVTFDLADPAAQRLGTAPELGRDRHDRWPRCGMLDLMIQHHPGCAVPDLGRKACRRLRQVALPSQEFGPPEIPAPFRTSAPSTPWSSGATSSSARSTASATTPADGPSSCASGCASRSCPFGRAVRPGSSQSCEGWSVRVERRSPGRDAGGPHGPDQLARAPVARTTGIQVARSRA